MGFLIRVLWVLIGAQTLLRADDLTMVNALYDQAIRDQPYESPCSFHEQVIDCHKRFAPHPPTACSQQIGVVLQDIYQTLVLFDTISFILVKSDSIVCYLEDKRILWRGTELFSSLQENIGSKKRYLSDNQDRIIGVLKKGLRKTLKTEVCTKTRTTWGGWASGLWASTNRKINRVCEEGVLWDTDPTYDAIKETYSRYRAAYATFDLINLRYYDRSRLSGADSLALFQAFLAIDDKGYFDTLLS